MKQCIYIILVSVLLSGCATMEVTKMAEGDSFRPFYAKQVSQAYFNPTSNEIVIGVDLSRIGDNQQEQKCFNLDLTEALARGTGSLTLSVDHVTECPENDSVHYDHIPVKNISNRSVLRIATPSAWILGYRNYSLDKLWLIPTSDKNQIIIVEISKITTQKPAAYLLYPFSLVADIVTSPYQLFLYIFLANVTSAR